MVEEIETLDLRNEIVPSPKAMVLDEKNVNMGDLVFGKNNTREMLGILAQKKMETKNLGVQAKKITVKDVNGEMVVEFPDENGATMATKPNNWAKGQLIRGSMGNKNYFDDCKEKGPEGLAEYNMNAWLRGKESVQLIRTMDDTMRAFLGNEYLILDNYDALAEIATQVGSINAIRKIEGEKPLTIDKGSLSEGFMYVEILDPERTYDIGKGKMFSGMMSFSNSDVGGGAANGNVGFYNWACSNLHIKDTVMHKVHRGERLSEQIYGQKIVAKMSKVWIEAIGAGLANVMKNGQLFDVWAEELRESKEIKITNIDTTLKNLTSEAKMSKSEIAALAGMLMGDETIDQEDRGTGYALVEGLTRVAQKFGVDREHDLAKFAGSMTADNNKILAKVVA
jgi:hypothetical protein